jgi:hypothetical protein
MFLNSSKLDSRRFLMMRRILAGVFVFALMFTISLSAEQIKEMKKN